MKQWIIPYLKKYRWRVFLSAFWSLLGMASAAMLLFVSGYLISKTSLQPENIMIVYIPIVSVRAFSIGQALFPYLEKLVSHDIVLRILSKYRNRLYQILEPQAMFLQSRFQTGDLLTVLSEDIEKLQDFFIKTLLPAVGGLVVYSVFAIILGFFNLPFMFMMLALLGILVFLFPLLSYYLMVRHHRRLKDKRNNLYRNSTDALFGQFDWLVSGRTEEVIEVIKKENVELSTTLKKIKRWNIQRDFLIQLFVGLSVIAVMIWVQWETKEENFSPTIIAAFTLMTFAITDALTPLSSAVEEIPLYEQSLERMEELSATDKSSHKDVSGKLREDSTIELKELTYYYPEMTMPIIKDLSLKIKPKEKVAIIGRSGAGKSTLLKLIAGLLEPATGSVLIGGEKVNRGVLAKSISVLNQKPHLFHTTVKNNVRIGRETASEQEVIDALKRAEIYDLFHQLPRGIYTEMEEMGKRFSGGERQRIAFARALIQETPIILLDEPTTGLDPTTEKHLLETFVNNSINKTVVMVTHHLIGAPLMDRIILLDEGKTLLEGHHDELMEKSDYYRKLYHLDQPSLY